MKLHLLELDDLPLTRDVVADPFQARANGRATLRPETASSGLELVEGLEEADIAALPANWVEYQGARRALAIEYIERAGAVGRRVVVWINEDDERVLPFPNVIQFQHAFARKRPRVTEIRAFPPFHDDLAEDVFSGKLPLRDKAAKPTVGFCGQGRGSLPEELKGVAYKALARARYWSGRSELGPEPWASHLRLRARSLRQLKAAPAVDTNFLIRTRHRAGLEEMIDRRNPFHQTALQYYDNIFESDYTFCVRGGGNFSVRLSETLCLGRQPAVLDTDSVLPWPDNPFWRDTAVLATSIDDLVQGMVDQYGRVDGAGLKNQERAAREFWLDRISLPGYLSHFAELLEPK